jgi:XTP/dITP diphosphohydrolase
MADVCNKLSDKLIFRHPHVYHPSQIGAEEPKPLPFGVEQEDATGTTSFSDAKTAGDVVANWEQIKLKEKDGNKRVLSGVPDALPSLIKAYRLQDKARNVGFDWENREDVWDKVREEIGEYEAELRNLQQLPHDATDAQKSAARRQAEGELGDLLFSLINASRLYHLNPDNALEYTNRKFIRRFNYVEEKTLAAGKQLKDMTLGEMDALWNEAKEQEKKQQK